MDSLNLREWTIWPPLSFLVVTLYISYLWSRFISRQKIPSQFPWAGAGYSWFNRFKASWQSILGLDGLLLDGYHKYSKKNVPFVLPNIFTGHEVVLPMSQMRWLLEQPDHILSQHEINKQFLCADYTLLHPKIIGEARMANFIGRNLTRNLDTYAGAIVDEIHQALDEQWGTDTSEWHEISVYSVMLVIIGRLVNRVFVGEPLCRDPTYLYHSTKFAQFATIAGGLINLLPALCKPIFGPILTAYDKYHYRGMARIIEPIVRERLLTLGPGASFAEKNGSQHNDFIQWALLEALAGNDPTEKTPQMITKRLAVLGFAAIQSSAITVTNALLDIASSPDSLSLQNQLRIEANQTAAKNTSSGWTRASLAAMVKTDSVYRESLRLWSFVSHGVTKAVVARDGVVLPSGERLPYGTHVGIASYGPQHDEDVYMNPYTFDAFRFCRDRNSTAERSETKEDSPTAPKAFVTTSDYFMGFSHGRHACPGRFFASQQLKLLMANIVMDYDIRPETKRARNYWVNNTVGPDVGARIFVRRRGRVV